MGNWMLSTLTALTVFFTLVTPAQAVDEVALLTQLRVNLAEKPTAVHENLLPGLYGVYFNTNEPRTYVEVISNS